MVDKKFLVTGMFAASKLLGYVIGQAMKKYLPLVGIACLLLYCIGISYFSYQIWEEAHAIKAENAYLKEHCMVLGEEGDLMVPIEMFANETGGGINWTI